MRVPISFLLVPMTPLVLILSVIHAPALGSDDSSIRKAVVKVFASRRLVDLSSPWKRGTLKSVSGSGLWIGDGRVLTNFHMIIYASQVTIQPYESSERIAAKVVSISPEMDLAVLQLDNVGPFKNVQPPAFMSVPPKVSATVQVFGYPTGGSSQSGTEGIVSRIEYSTYSYGGRGLRIQVDAALNSGNSGGPAFVDNKVIGIVYSRLRSSDNIGYMIPSEEIRRFLTDVEDGQYDGKPRLLDKLQNLQNAALRTKYGLKASTTGVLVRKPYSDAAEYPLKAGDVITHIGGHQIDNMGIVRTSHNLRLSMHYLVSQLETDGQAQLTILRDGETLKLNVPVQRQPKLLIPPLKGRFPSYFVYGPLVFLEATSNYLDGVERMLSSSSSRTRSAGVAMLRLMQQRRSPLLNRRYDAPRFEGEQLVIVSTRLLPHRISMGYRNPTTNVLKSVNGTKIKNLRHLVETLRELDAQQVSFDFADKNVETLILNRAEILAAMDVIISDNGIVKQCSPDLQAAWNGSQSTEGRSAEPH